MITASGTLAAIVLSGGVLTASSPQNGGFSAEHTIQFSDPSHCAPSADMQQLLHMLLPLADDRDGMLLPPTPPADIAGLAQRVERRRDAATQTGTVSLNTRWHGLQLQTIARWIAPESDHRGFTLYFAESSEPVVAVLNRIGFGLPSSGNIPAREDNPLTISVESEAHGTRLVCSY